MKPFSDPDWHELDTSKPEWWEVPHYDEDDDCPCPNHAAMRMDKHIRNILGI